MRKLYIDILPSIKKLDLSYVAGVRTQLAGNYKSVFKGKGVEFKDYRKYSLGDDSSLIDWKASARGNRLLIKEYEEERNLEIFFLVDTSSSMMFGTTKKLKSEYAGEMVIALSYAILSQGFDKVGLGLFNEKVLKLVNPAKGPSQLYMVADMLSDPRYYGNGYDLKKALEEIIPQFRKNTLLIIVSDFIGLKNNWTEHFRLATSKYKVFGFMIRDPADNKLPNDESIVKLKDPYSQKRMRIKSTKGLQRRYEQQVQKEKKQIKNIFLNNNVPLLELDTSKPFAEPILAFFRFTAKRR